MGAAPSSHPDRGPENIITHSNGREIRVPAVEVIDHIRVCAPDGTEIAYWSIDEVREDPALILGAIVGATTGTLPA